MGRVTARRRVLRIREGAVEWRPDTVAAEEHGLTLAGFLRGSSMNVYAGPTASGSKAERGLAFPGQVDRGITQDSVRRSARV